MKNNVELVYGLSLTLVVAVLYVIILSVRIEEFKETAIKQEYAKYNNLTGEFEWRYNENTERIK